MKHKNKWKVGDRVYCPAVDRIPGTVSEVGFNGYTKVAYDDGVIGSVTENDLAPASELEPAILETQILATLKNEECGIEAHVSKISTGFSVALFDVDAQKMVEHIRVYKTEAEARAFAKKLVA